MEIKILTKVKVLKPVVLWIMFLFLLNSISYSQMGELQFEWISIESGLSQSSVLCIYQDHSNLWISTNNGLSKFNTRTKQFKNFFKSDGLQSSEFGVNACCKLKSGEMIFGGINGFNIFHPDSIKDNLDIPSVVLTGFKIFNKPVAVGEQIDGRTILEESISECEERTNCYRARRNKAGVIINTTEGRRSKKRKAVTINA